MKYMTIYKLEYNYLNELVDISNQAEFRSLNQVREYFGGIAYDTIKKATYKTFNLDKVHDTILKPYGEYIIIMSE